ncbi:MAG TPA: hypothetical protein VFY45_09905, partial [Baekduia sp.]|nr:hypothetical protein [Baekduia sp.]
EGEAGPHLRLVVPRPRRFALVQIAYYGFVEGEWIAALVLLPGVFTGVVVAWWLPRALARYGEQH